MSTCCNNPRFATVNAKCSDMCTVDVEGFDSAEPDYVPPNMNLGEGGDYIDFTYCLNCGHMQGDWPVELTALDNDDEV